MQVFYYVFACIGMELFKGHVTYYNYDNLTDETNNCGNARLNGSEFFIKRYCKNNFNNIIHAFVVLFDLMVVNQWHDILFIIILQATCNVYYTGLFHMMLLIPIAA